MLILKKALKEITELVKRFLRWSWLSFDSFKTSLSSLISSTIPESINHKWGSLMNKIKTLKNWHLRHIKCMGFRALPPIFGNVLTAAIPSNLDLQNEGKTSKKNYWPSPFFLFCFPRYIHNESHTKNLFSHTAICYFNKMDPFFFFFGLFPCG